MDQLQPHQRRQGERKQPRHRLAGAEADLPEHQTDDAGHDEDARAEHRLVNRSVEMGDGGQRDAAQGKRAKRDYAVTSKTQFGFAFHRAIPPITTPGQKSPIRPLIAIVAGKDIQTPETAPPLIEMANGERIAGAPLTHSADGTAAPNSVIGERGTTQRAEAPAHDAVRDP